MIEVKHRFPGTNEVHLVIRRTTDMPVIWRPASGYIGRGRVWYEIVAARLDRLLQTNLIPWAWEETHSDKRGVMQAFIDGVDGYAWLDSERVTVKGLLAYHQLQVLDYILSNNDRYDHHVIWDKAARIWGIDNTNIFQDTVKELPVNGGIENMAIRCRNMLSTDAMWETFASEVIGAGYIEKATLDRVRGRMEVVSDYCIA